MEFEINVDHLLTTCKDIENKVIQLINKNKDIIKTEEYNTYNLHRFESIECQIPSSIYEYLKKMSIFYKNTQYQIDEVDIAIPEDGLDCVYISIINKYILKEKFKLDTNLVQGFYKCKNNSFARSFFGENSIGFHAWLVFRNKLIIDTTFYAQQYNSLEAHFEDSIIFGKFDERILFKGYIENEKNEHEYIEKLIKHNNLTKDNWINKFYDVINNIDFKIK